VTGGFDVAPQRQAFLKTVREAGRRRLPARYATDLWDSQFRDRLGSLLEAGVSVLDIGAGRRPTVLPNERPAGVRYVGLDLDADELDLAPQGSYDEAIVAPIEQRIPALDSAFDLAVSFLAFEHVESTERALENLHSYLRPGGRLLAHLAGARSLFSVANRLLPGRLAKRLLQRTQGRQPDTVFPAKYDHCTYSGLSELLSSRWSDYQVTPQFTGAGYVLFSRALTAGYVAYEEWTYRRDHRDLAPYYLIEAQR
jgi:SAM-dependent methyltransferase